MPRSLPKTCIDPHVYCWQECPNMRTVTKAFFLPVQSMGSYPPTVSTQTYLLTSSKWSGCWEAGSRGKERNQGTHHTLQLPAFAWNKQRHLFALLLERSDLNPLEPSRKAHAWYRLEGYSFSKSFPPIFRKTMNVYKQWIKTPKSHSEVVKIWVKHSHKVLIIL